MADTVNASIVAHFQTLEDPRLERTKKHLSHSTEFSGAGAQAHIGSHPR